MPTKDESKTSLGSRGHGFFPSQDQLTTADVYRLAQQLKGLGDKLIQVMAMRGQKSPDQVLEGPDYNKDVFSRLEKCTGKIIAVTAKDEFIAAKEEIQAKSDQKADDVHANHNVTYSPGR